MLWSEKIGTAPLERGSLVMPLKGHGMLDSVGLRRACVRCILATHFEPRTGLGSIGTWEFGLVGRVRHCIFSFKWSLDDAMVVSLGETGASAPAVRNHFWNVAGQRCSF